MQACCAQLQRCCTFPQMNTLCASAQTITPLNLHAPTVSSCLTSILYLMLTTYTPVPATYCVTLCHASQNLYPLVTCLYIATNSRLAHVSAPCILTFSVTVAS